MSDIQFEYRYDNIILLKSLFAEPEVSDVEELKKDLSFNIDISLNFTNDGENIVTDLSLELFNEQQEVNIFEIQIRHLFDLKSDSDLIAEDEEGKFLNIPQDRLFPFVTIPYSTSRGIIKQELAGTRFSELILPIVDPHEIMAEGKVRELTAFDEE